MVHLEVNHKPLVDEARKEGFDPIDATYIGGNQNIYLPK